MTSISATGSVPSFPSVVAMGELASRVADAYIAALQGERSPLVQSETAVARRRERAQKIVRDVLAALEGNPVQRAAADPWSAIQELRAGEIPPDAATRGTEILFAQAFRILADALPCDSESLGSALHSRLLADSSALAHALFLSNAFDELTVEVIDEHELAKHLSRQRAEVFRLIGQGATNQQIASTLGISQTTVKAHIRTIGRILEGRGRRSILRRARELGVLVTIPIALLGGYLGDAASSIVALF